MKNLSLLLWLLFMSTSMTAHHLASGNIKNERIVSLNGAITEIICAFGNQNKIVGVDVTSTFPTDLKAKDLGHVRSISIESLLSLKPTRIFATERDLSPDLIGRLKATGMNVHIIKQVYSVEGTQKMIQEVATILKLKNSASLIQKIDASLQKVKVTSQQPKILFVYARGAGTLMVAGKNTPIEAMMKLAGGKNAVQGFEDYKPLTPEALIAGNPDVILFFDKGLESLGGVEGALKIEGLKQTNAGKNKRIIAMDGALLSGFGPRLGDAVVELNQLIHAK